jgi:hypothetical protein
LSALDLVLCDVKGECGDVLSLECFLLMLLNILDSINYLLVLLDFVNDPSFKFVKVALHLFDVLQLRLDHFSAICTLHVQDF